jgi:hypothetical protein
MNGLEWIQQNYLLLLPLIVLQIGLMVAALLDLVRRPATRGPRWAWVLVILFVNTIGPIVYFLAGRRDE